MPVDISIAAGLTADAARLEGAARHLLISIGHARGELGVSLVGDNTIKELNRRYRKCDESTDVLAFSQVDGQPTAPSGPTVLGDVVISVETANRQADCGGWSIEEELNRLLVHGLLHLVGYDHEAGGDEAIRMKREEERLGLALREAGYPCAGDEVP